jgi:hypothetical protein
VRNCLKKKNDEKEKTNHACENMCEPMKTTSHGGA